VGNREPFSLDDLLERLDGAVSGAVAKRLCHDVEVAVLARAGEYTRFAGDVVHQPQDITETQFLVRAVVDGHAYRTATTVESHLAAAIELAASAAREIATTADGTGSADVAGPQPEGTTGTLWFDDTAAFDTSARVRAARAAMDSAQAAGGEAAGMFGRAVTQQAVVTSRGLRRSTMASEASGAATIDVADGTAHWTDLSRSAARLQVAQSVDAAVAQAARSRGRVELEPGAYPAVLGAEAAGELLQFLPALGFSGALAASGIGIVAARHGEPVASPLVSVADDVTADIGLPIGFDCEGTTKRRVAFFDAGRVGDAVTDRGVAAQLGRASTGHGHIAREQVPEPEAANLVMAPGELSEDDLIAGVERGVYVQRFWYTRLVDRAAGTITGVTRDACFLIENGRLTRPLAGMRFTESVLACLAGVDGVGRELRAQPVMNIWNGATAAPPIRAAAFRFGAAPLEGDR
jgi:predicted Zn-dependent protease